MTAHDASLVTVARFRTPGEAHVARTFLEAAGVRALVAEGDGLRFDPFRASPAERVRLLVRAEDLEAGRELLATAAADGGSR